MRDVTIHRDALANLHGAVLDWFASDGRDLAFRHASDPWAILVSEVMAQQTQAARAAEHWTRFMEQFPTAASLAAASPADVIRAWRGLGYNRRALGLRGAAIAISTDHGGRVPDTLDALVRLPGIGPYTARAVLAIAYGHAVAALDVNIRRVLGRAFGGQAVAMRDLQSRADGYVPKGRAAAWTHALMDIGAAFCRPHDPRCGGCPLRTRCAFADGRSVAGSTENRRARPRPPRTAPFPATTRWLRGRILDRLRDAAPGHWIEFDASLGVHPQAAVLAALTRMSAEGLLELDGARARLATA